MSKQIFKIAVTDDCNMNCIYCQVKRKTGGDQPRHPLFSDDEIIRFVRMATRAGANTIHITGGEPLMRPGVIGLMERIRDFPRVEKLILSTNGSLIHEAELKEIIKYTDEVHVSLDAAQAFDLKDICGLGQCMNEILNCAWSSCSADKKVRITCMMLQNARKHVPILCDFGKNVDFDVCFKELTAYGTYGGNVKPLAEEELMELLRKRYPDMQKVKSEDPCTDFYRTGMLKSRIGIVHTNVERNDMAYLAPDGVLYCGDRMRRMINLRMKLENGANYDDLALFFA